MFRNTLLILVLFSSIFGFAQQVETARFELPRWGKTQGCHFESFQEHGGLMVYETDKIDEEKNRLWNFIALDSSLYEVKSHQMGLPEKLSFFDSKSSRQWAAFVFVGEKHRSDSIPFWVVTYHRTDEAFDTIMGMLPDRAQLQSIAMLDGTLLFSVNTHSGNGFLAQFNLADKQQRTIVPNVSNDYVMFQLEAVPEAHQFVLAAREFVDKRYKATSFFVYSRAGYLVHSHRFENGENAGLGRMCFAFDAANQLVVYATLEREGNKKVNIEGITEDFSRIAVGVTWIKFAAGGEQVKTYLFKNLPDIDQALTASDRLRVKQELLRMQQGKKLEKDEIALQFYTPRLVKYGDSQVFVAEAFQPVYHTETRMEYGFYGAYPMSYSVFDGYDFFSEILLAFDDNGELRWHNSVRFENDLTDNLHQHASEAVAHNELVVVSPSHNTLRYEVFDVDGSSLLQQQVAPLDFLYGTDSFDDEYDAGIYLWFGNRFLVHGCQIVQNPVLRNTRRAVYYVQKVQYE